MLRFVVLALVASASQGGDVAVCPGEGPRYGDFKCDHDETHRVCATLVDQEGEPLSWGQGNFWQITGQEAFQWDDKITSEPNKGDSWCICMWATANLIKSAGCNNVHIRCGSTDVNYVLKHYTDGATDLSDAHACLQQKCGGAASFLTKGRGRSEEAL